MHVHMNVKKYNTACRKHTWRQKASCFWNAVLWFILSDDVNNFNPFSDVSRVNWFILVRSLLTVLPILSESSNFSQRNPFVLQRSVAVWFIKLNHYFLPEIFLIRLEYDRSLVVALTSLLLLFFRVCGHVQGSDALSDRHCLPRHAHAATSPYNGSYFRTLVSNHSIFIFFLWWVITMFSYFRALMCNHNIFIFSFCGV
jgi:hypothetical protein